MRLPGIWLYGALSLITLASAGFFYNDKFIIVLALFSMGSAYAAEFLAQEGEWGRSWGGFVDILQASFLLCSVTAALIGYSYLVLN